MNRIDFAAGGSFTNDLHP